MSNNFSLLMFFFCCCCCLVGHSATAFQNPILDFQTTSSSSSSSSLSSSYSRSFSLFAKKSNSGIDKGFNLLEIASSVVPQGQIVGAVSESWKFAWSRMMAELAPQDKATGSYVRPSYMFDGYIGKNGQPFIDEPGRYHVYTGNPCPWCHRVGLTIQLLGLSTVATQDVGLPQIGWTVLEDNPRKASRGGWVFSNQQPDRIFGGCTDLRQLYDILSPSFQGRCTAPLLVDTKTRQIVSNESSDIIRMLNGAKLGGTSQRINLVPDDLIANIDETNEWTYRLLNNGVYRCGFSTTQSAYDQASADVRQGLERCEDILSKQAYLCSNDQITEADVRLLPTMLRFDAVYAPLFKAGGTHTCIRADYPNLFRWLKRCWNQYPVTHETIDLADACGSYYKQLFPLNPGGIVPTPITAKSIGLEE